MLEGNGPYGHYAIRNTIVIRTSIFIFLDFPYIFAQFRSNIVREISKIIANVLTCKNPELRKCHRRIRISLLSKANHVIIYRCNISVIICTTQKLNRSTLSILIVFFFFFFFFFLWWKIEWPTIFIFVQTRISENFLKLFIHSNDTDICSVFYIFYHWIENTIVRENCSGA